MRTIHSVIGLGLAVVVLLAARTTAQAQNYTTPSRALYPSSYSTYYYYMPYDSGYYTVHSPGFRTYYGTPGASYYYRPDLPPLSPSLAASRPAYSPGNQTPVPPTSPGYASPGSSSYSASTSQSQGFSETPGKATSPGNGTVNYPAPPESFNPDARRSGSPGLYWYSKADLHRFYYDPRSYELNKLEIDQEYYNPRSPYFYSPNFWNAYRIPGHSNFYVTPSISGLR